MIKATLPTRPARPFRCRNPVCLLAAFLLFAGSPLWAQTNRLIFPQIADGQGLTSEILLQNHSGIAQSGRLLLRQKQGEPLIATFNGTTASEFDLEVPAGGVLKLTSQGSGPVQSGYAVVEVEGTGRSTWQRAPRAGVCGVMPTQ